MNHLQYSPEEVFIRGGITKAQTASVLRAMRDHSAEFKGTMEVLEPYVFPGAHEGCDDGVVVVSWEEGPYEWAYEFYLSNESVHVEALTSWCIGIYKP